MREKRTLVKENSNHNDNDDNDEVDIKTNVQSVSQRNWRF